MPYIDFPNSPADGDEFQAPNKFVYRWTDENRWKNVPRPLVIPDYIWPDMEPPGDDDPYDDGDPPGDDDPWDDPDDPVDGGGGEDWILEVIEMPVNNGEITQEIDLIINTLGGADLVNLGSGYGWGVIRGDSIQNPGNGFNAQTHNDTKCQIPYLAQVGTVFTNNRMYASSAPELVEYYTIRNGTVWGSYPTSTIINYGTEWMASNINLQDFLTVDGYANKTEIRMRASASFSYAGKYSGQNSGLTIRCTDVNGIVYTGNPRSGVIVPFFNNYSTVTRVTTDWITIDAYAENVEILVEVGGNMQGGLVTVEIDDPYNPPSRDNLPVGFATNPEMSKMWVTFAGTSNSVMRSIKNGDPGRLSNSSYDQIEYGVNYLDPVTAGGGYDPDWQNIWFREDENWFMYVDGGNTNSIRGRHLYTTGDIESHSEYNPPQYDFRSYGSYTTMGYTVKDIAMNPDGDILYTLDDVGDIRSYNLSTAWDLSTASLADTIDMSGWGATCFDITQDGFVIVIAKAGWVRQLILDTAWDLSTVYDSGFQRYFALEEPIDICVSADTGSIMVLDIPADENIGYRIYNYTRNI